jgi:hypothetical protein
VNKLRSFLLILLNIQFIFPLLSQTGGNNTYEFLNIANSARVAALGGNFVSVKDDDINLSLSNPSLINKKMHNFLSLSFIDYYSDITAGYSTYSRTFDKYGSFAATLQFINYGKFLEADATGETYGEFSAGEYALNLGWGRQLDSSFLIGANLKFIYSDLYIYNSFGIATDISATYFSSKRNFATSLILKNIGRQIVGYRNGNSEALPFEIQLGLSKKLEHTPIRFSILANNLQKWDLTWDAPDELYPSANIITDDTLSEKRFSKFLDKGMRHLVFGAEIMPSKNLRLRLSYNYRKRKELKVDSKPGFTGFAWGIGIRISKFRIDYGRSVYHLAGAPNNISITTNLGDFFDK